MSARVLEDLCELVVDCKNRTPPEAPPGEGVAFAIGTPHVLDGRIQLQDAKPVTQQTFDTWTARAIPRAGDVVLTREAPVGRVGRVEAGMKICLGQRTMLLRADSERTDARYLKYLLLSPEIQSTLHAHASGSTLPHLRVAQVRTLPIPSVPPLETQRAIGDLLGALDDKIIANDRIATTVESLLRSMYLAHCVAIEEIRIGDIGYLVRESVKPDSLSGDEPYIGLEHMPRKQVWLSSWGKSSEVGSVKSAFESGDVLFGKLRPYFHKVGMAQVNGVCSTDIIVVRASKTEYRSWLLMALSSDEVVAHATARSDGTRMPRAKWSDLADFKVPWPDADQVACFEESAAPLIERAVRGAAESRTLAQLRDTLLPQLMSGKLRVREAEKLVEAAV